jgi:hypothetical protein
VASSSSAAAAAAAAPDALEDVAVVHGGTDERAVEKRAVEGSGGGCGGGSGGGSVLPAAVPLVASAQVLAGPLTVRLFCAITHCREDVARTFLELCGTVGAAVRAHSFCPTFYGPRNHVAWARLRCRRLATNGATNERGASTCFYCGTRLLEGRVRVVRTTTQSTHGKLLSFPRDREVWEAMDGACIVCVACWDHAAQQRALTNHCSQTGLLPAACAGHHEYLDVQSLPYDAAEAVLLAARTASASAGGGRLAGNKRASSTSPTTTAGDSRRHKPSSPAPSGGL